MNTTPSGILNPVPTLSPAAQLAAWVSYWTLPALEKVALAPDMPLPLRAACLDEFHRRIER